MFARKTETQLDMGSRPPWKSRKYVTGMMNRLNTFPTRPETTVETTMVCGWPRWNSVYVSKQFTGLLCSRSGVQNVQKNVYILLHSL